MRNGKAISLTIRNKLLLLCLSLLLIPSLVVGGLSYETAASALNDSGEKRLKNSVRSTMELIAMLDEQVEAGAVGLEDAEEFVRTSLLGPKQENGTRPISSSIDIGQFGYLFVIDDNGMFVEPTPTWKAREWAD